MRGGSGSVGRSGGVGRDGAWGISVSTEGVDAKTAQLRATRVRVTHLPFGVDIKYVGIRISTSRLGSGFPSQEKRSYQAVLTHSHITKNPR